MNTEEKIKVVLCEPGKLARITEIGTSLEELQQAAGGGLIETFYPFEPELNAVLICNEEGKFNGMEPCRAIKGEDGKIVDIVFGPFFICDCGGENFGSLSEDLLKHFEGLFRYPEQYYRIDGEIVAIPYIPRTKATEGGM